MLKFCIKAIALFIPNKECRHYFRAKWTARLEAKKQIKQLNNYGNYRPIQDFQRHSVAPKSVLVLEFNDFHGVTLPAYVHYFAELGYKIDCFLHWGQNVQWQPLCRLTEKWTAFAGDEQKLIEVLNSEKIKQYDFVFVNTTFYYGVLSPYPTPKSVFKMLGTVPSGRYGTLMVEHNYDPFIKEYDEEKYLKAGNLFTCLGFRNTKMLAPAYLGQVEITPKNEGKICFLSIGTVNPSNKNMNMLFNACQNLIEQGITNFEVQVIGAGNVKDLPKPLQKHFRILGHLTYREMYEALEQGDFLLNLFDPENKEHHKYLDNWATGSCTLFYSFAKLPLMHTFFAKSYFLDNDNAVVYDDLTVGMKQAIEMTPGEYQRRQAALAQLAKDLQVQSLRNLSEQTERMKSGSTEKADAV